MKGHLVVAVLLLAGLSIGANAQRERVFIDTMMPKPARLLVSQGTLAWNSSFSVSTNQFHDARLDAAIQRMLREFERLTGTAVTKEIRTESTATTLVVDVQGAGELIQGVDENEAYTLTVTPSGAKLRAATVIGAMRGMQTFLQLLQTAPDGYFFPAVQIDDSPRFRWRGLMVDCGRHFEPIDVIERTLDAMASVKLNVFHWHLTEDQGFRIESKLFPKLTGMGSDGLFYTQDQAREIVAYARERGIRVVPEFDMPGHSRSWFVGYPELASGPGPYSIRREFGIENAAMDPTRESTYTFIDSFVGEMGQIFPDPYMHIGGDESNGAQWNTNAKIQEFMRAHSLKSNAALQAYFNQRLVKILEKHSKRVIGWDEVLTPGLPKDVVVQSWRGEDSLIAGAKQGYQGILSQPYYLDAMKSAGDHYLADPLPSNSNLTTEQRTLILGGEICMWAEHINASSIDSRIWPRSAAIAERFWSAENVVEPDDMYRRLAVESIRLDGLGVRHLSHEDQALRQLAKREDIDALRVFSSVLEPVSFSERYDAQHTDQLTPLDNLVDAVRPDPPSRHDTNRLARQFLKAPGSSEDARAALELIFARCVDAAPAILAQVTSAPLLALAEPRAQQLHGLATAGVEALNYLSKGMKAPAGWKQRNLALIEAAKKPQAMVRFTFLAALNELVVAVQE